MINWKIFSEQNGISEDICRRGTLLCHLLAVAYCLRALCTQEAEPNSKVLMHKRLVSRIA